MRWRIGTKARNVAIVVIAFLLMASCAGVMQLRQNAASSYESAPTLPAPAAVPPSNVASGGAASSADTSPNAASGAPAASDAQSSSGVTLPNSLSTASQMLIQNATLTLEVKSPADALMQLEAIARSDQGQRTNSQSSYDGDRLTITATIVVPADQFADAISRVRKLGKELNENITAQDVTEEYVDVQAQISNLKSSEQQLQSLMQRATTVGEVLTVQRELSNVQGQINRLQARANYLSQKSATSTINVTLQMPSAASSLSASREWQPLATLLQALSAALRFWQGVINVAIWVVVFGLPLAVIALVARAAWIWSRGRRPIVHVVASAEPPSTTA